MLTESLEVHAAAAARAQGDGEQRRQPPRVLLERFDTEEFDSWRTRSAAVTRVSLIPVLAEIRTSLGIHGAIVPRAGGRIVVSYQLTASAAQLDFFPLMSWPS